MTTNITREKWHDFCDDISRSMLDWEVAVEVLDKDLGDQTLAQNVPFRGMTFESKEGDVVEIELGDASNHETHMIREPRTFAVDNVGSGSRCVVEIENAVGTKTLVQFIQPFPTLDKWKRSEVAAR